MDWILPEDLAVPSSFQQGIGGHPLVSDILFRRGITDLPAAKAFLDPQYYTPSPPVNLPDVDITAHRLLEAVEAGERILVWGDFDVDGQTSTSLLVDALQRLGASVGFHIPHRIKHGHGVHTEVLMDFITEGYEVILTCDTGIAAHDAVDAAHARGVTVLITDHHALPPDLPQRALGIVNPQRLPPDHPLRDLPGVGVAYKVIQRLYQLAGRSGEEKQFLDLVALGIVSDVANQQHDTRYLLQLGIERLRNPQRVGLQELMRAAQVDPANLASDTIGFQIGPRLNALGRLDDATMAVELLTTDNALFAQQIAQQLEILNNRRKQVDNQIYAAAQEQIVGDPTLLDYEILLLGGDHWHPGVIGIVASRLVEKYGKPTLLLSTPEGQPARGSARSVPGVDIGATIAANEDLLLGHGGHPGAAGVALHQEFIPQLRRRLSSTIARTRDVNVKVGKKIDAIVTLNDLSMELAEELNRLSPFGEGNPPVALMTHNLHATSQAGFGVDKKHRRVTVEDTDGVNHPVTWWRGSDYESELPEAFDLLYIPRINDYRGRRSLQLEWVDFRPVEGLVIETGPRYMPVDLRDQDDVIGLLPEDDYVVWVEGLPSEEQPFDESVIGTRETIKKASSLIIWTIPPGPRELQQVLTHTQARTIYIVGINPATDAPETFLKRLLGLVKYAARRYDDGIPLSRLAGATGQREVTVRRGLEWLEARGQIRVDWEDSSRVVFHLDQTPSHDTDLETLQSDILALLSETAAYRAYFRQADLAQFFN